MNASKTFIETRMDKRYSTEMTEMVSPSSPHRIAGSDEATRRMESKLRMKMDLYIVPTVALLYLMCFIDRANIGQFFERVASKITTDCYR